MDKLTIYDIPNEIIVDELFKKWLTRKDLSRVAQTCIWWRDCAKIIPQKWDMTFLPQYFRFFKRPTNLDLAGIIVLTSPEERRKRWYVYGRKKPPKNKDLEKKNIQLADQERKLTFEIDKRERKMRGLKKQRSTVRQKLTTIEKRVRHENVEDILKKKKRKKITIIGNGLFVDPITGRIVEVGATRYKYLVKKGIIKSV